MFTCSRAITDGVLADDAALSIGVTDGTNHAVAAAQSEDDVASSDVDRIATTDEVVQILTIDGGIDGEANFKEWTTNGVVITWGDAPAGAYLLTVIFYAGDDVTADVGTHVLEWDQTSSISGLGYEPDVLFMFTHGSDFDDTPSTSFNIQLGIGVNGTSIQQGTHSIHVHNGGSPSIVTEFITDNRINASIYNGAPFISRTFKINSFDVGGITFSDMVEGEHEFDNTVAYLTLNFGGAASAWVGWVDTKTSTGSQAITDPAFTPQAIITLPTWLDTLNSVETSAVGSIGMGAFDDDDEYTTSIFGEDGVATTNTGNVSDDKALLILDDAGAADVVAAFTSFDAHGWTWNYSAYNATARQVLCLAIEETGAGALTLVVADSAQVQITETPSLAQHNVLAVDDSAQVQATENVDLAPNTVLVVQDSAQVQTTENVDLTQHYALAVDDSAQVQTTETPSLAQHNVLAVDDSAQVQTTETPSLAQHNVLVIQDSAQIQTTENVDLESSYTLTVADSSQLQESDNVTLSQHNVLVIQDSAQAQVTDNVTFSGYAIPLVVQDSAQVQTTENVSLAQHNVLVVQDSAQVQVSENVTLTQHYVLVVADIAQVQATDNVIPTQHYTLIVQDGAQVQATDNITLSPHYVLTLADSTQLQETENVEWVVAQIPGTATAYNENIGSALVYNDTVGTAKVINESIGTAEVLIQ